MGVSIITRPIKSGCNWNAVRNMVPYKLRREDAGVTQVNNNGGLTQLQFNGIDLTAYFQVGNTITAHKADGTENYKSTITASSFSGGNTLVTINIPYASTTLGAASILNNLSKRTDWKIEFEVFKTSDNSSLNSLKFSYTADPTTAYVYFNIATILKNYVKADWTPVPSHNAVEADTATPSVYIKYQEYFDGVYQAIVSDSANPIYGVHAAMQIFHADTTYGHGANLLSYFPADNGRSWMTRFRLNSILFKMRVWRNYPFTLSFIWPDGVTNIQRKVRQEDAQGNLLTDVLQPLAATAGKIHRMNLGTLNAAAKKLYVDLINTASGFFFQSLFNSYVGWANLGLQPTDFLFGTGGASYNFNSKALRSGVITATIPGGTDIQITLVVVSGQFDNLTVTLRQTGGGATQVVNFGTRTAGTHGIAVTTTNAFDQLEITATCNTDIQNNELGSIAVANVSSTVPVSLTNNTFTTNINPWFNQGAAGPNDWVWAAGDVASFSTSPGGQNSKYLLQTITGVVTGDLLSGTIDTDLGYDGVAEIVLYDSGSTSYQVLQGVAITGAAGMTTYNWSGTAAFTPTHFGFRVTRNSGTSPSTSTVSAITLNKANLVTYTIPDDTFANIGANWSQVGTGFVWSQGSGTARLFMPAEYFAVYFVQSGLTSDTASIGVGPPIATGVDVEISTTLEVQGVGSAQITIDVYSGAGLEFTFVHNIANTDGVVTFTDNFTVGANPITSFRIRMVSSTGDNFLVQVNSMSAYTPGSILSQLEIDVEDEPCLNPVYLWWKNSTGGDSFYMFQINQEVTYNLKDGRRKRLTLFADNLELVEWEAINELNNPADVIKDNILELSESVIKTHTKIGQQVYRVDKDGNKIGVIVIPTSNKIKSKDSKCSIEITIDYPDIFY